MPADNRRDWRFLIATIAAMLVFGMVYKYTLRAWFQEDDFAWLGLGLQVHSWPELWHALFSPMAEGTVRVFSERAFFMGFHAMFGLHALPYRMAVYATQLANIAVFGMIARRLTKSYWAAFVAPVLWSVNAVLAWPLTWTSAYNEILCSLIFLVSFYALMRYVETGNWRFNVLQWVVFLIGFGVLEINAVYPLIAILYTALFAREFVKRTLALLAPSAIFVAIRFAAGLNARKDVYALHLDLSIFDTLARYWNIALGAGPAGQYFSWIHFAALPLTVAFSVAILGFAVWRAWRGDRIPVFCLGWFVISVAPFLPITEHVSDYYAAVPAIGLALLGGWAMVVSLGSAWFYRALTLGLIALYMACAIPMARLESRYIWTESIPVKKLVLGVKEVHEKNPGKIIFLDNVDGELFLNGVYDHPFRLFSAEVYLTPENARNLRSHPELKNVENYTLPESEMLSALAQNRALIYGAHEAGIPRRIDVGLPRLESLLGASWYGPEGSFRWMPKDASVRLGVPENGAGEVRVEAFCAPVQIADRPLEVWVSVDGVSGQRTIVRECNSPIILRSPLHVAAGTSQIEVGLHVDRTIRVAGDQRDLGLAVRSIEVLGQP